MTVKPAMSMMLEPGPYDMKEVHAAMVPLNPTWKREYEDFVCYMVMKGSGVVAQGGFMKPMDLCRGDIHYVLGPTDNPGLADVRATVHLWETGSDVDEESIYQMREFLKFETVVTKGVTTNMYGEREEYRLQLSV